MKNQKIRFLTVVATILVMTTYSIAQDDDIEKERRHLEMAQHLHDRWRIEEIERAQSAGPAEIAWHATIIQRVANGNIDVLREGTNGWTCVAEDRTRDASLATLVSGPFCMDKNAMDWRNAWMSHTEPKLAGPGIVYMLQGDDFISSATDPFATESSGKSTHIEAPHLMFVGIKLGQNVFSTDPKSGGPWVMWAGTPFEILILPVNVPKPVRYIGIP